MKKRKAVSKSVRFAVLARDQFKCRYCGSQAGNAKLVIDHIIPVKIGGSSEFDNLITACEPCNQGKSANVLPMGLSELDQAKIQQEREYLIEIAKLAKKAEKAKKELRQTLVNKWCEEVGRDEMSRPVATMLVNFSEEYGPEKVMEWIEIAARMIGFKRDDQIARYICGIRKRQAEEGKL